MSSFEDLKKRWAELSGSPFPSMPQGRTIGGVNLTVLWSEAGGIIETGVQTGGKLGTRHKLTLEKNGADLKKALEQFESGPHQVYFTSFSEIIDLALSVLETVQ